MPHLQLERGTDAEASVRDAPESGGIPPLDPVEHLECKLVRVEAHDSVQYQRCTRAHLPVISTTVPFTTSS
jgi:hypothetical protein